MTLIEFLLARVAEDEAQAGAATERVFAPNYLVAFERVDGTRTLVIDPDRLRDDCEAKRRIVGLHRPWDLGSCHGCGGVEGTSPHRWPCPTLRAVAAPYADHPDYREEWRP